MNLRKFHAVAIALVASAALLNQACATTIHIGTPYGPGIRISNTGHSDLTNGAAGGDFANSTINGNANGTGGTPLPWVYCVDVVHTVAPPATYTNASIDSTTGIVNGAPVNNANQIAYVLLNHGGDLANQGAVQAAVWFLEYGTNTSVITRINDGAGNNSPTLIATAQQWVLDAQGANTTNLASQLAWLTLSQNNNVQGLVTLVTPEPSTFAIAALAGLGMMGYARKRRSR